MSGADLRDCHLNGANMTNAQLRYLFAADCIM